MYGTSKWAAPCFTVLKALMRADEESMWFAVRSELCWSRRALMVLASFWPRIAEMGWRSRRRTEWGGKIVLEEGSVSVFRSSSTI